MPAVACRNAGLDCDWFFVSDDLGAVILETFRHSEVQHPEDIKYARDHYKLWEVIMMERKAVITE